MSDYKIMSNKIRGAKDVNTLDKLDSSLVNLYNNGIFTVSEFSRLDSVLVDKLCELKDC